MCEYSELEFHVLLYKTKPTQHQRSRWRKTLDQVTIVHPHTRPES